MSSIVRPRSRITVLRGVQTNGIHSVLGINTVTSTLSVANSYQASGWLCPEYVLGYPPGYSDISGGTLYVSSSSANDKGGGAGAQTVRIYGVDSSGDELSELVTLSGTNSVTVAGAYAMVNLAQIAGAGASTPYNQGSIICGSGYPFSRTAFAIPSGYATSMQGSICVPNGYTGVITYARLACIPTAATMMIVKYPLNVLTNGYFTVAVAGIQSGGPGIRFDDPIVIEGGSCAAMILGNKQANTSLSIAIAQMDVEFF